MGPVVGFWCTLSRILAREAESTLGQKIH